MSVLRWSKRSHKHSYNALGGVGIIIGACTKKILHIGVRNKYCITCSKAESRGEQPKDHDCFRNWNESSQAMEADAILEGFNACEVVHGVRYMRVIGDGDSSVMATLQSKGPHWARHVTKIECANHACKCLRSNLEKLVDEKPNYKGKNKLTKVNRVRITTAVRSAIKVRSANPDKTQASKLLRKDIINSVDHVFGHHDNCDTYFCMVQQQNVKTQVELEDKSDPSTENICDDADEMVCEQAQYWIEGSTESEMEAVRGDSPAGVINLEKELIQDVKILLNRVGEKSSQLLGNFTSNLAENWMCIRTKFDGGKRINRCLRSSWHSRCFGAALRSNKGPSWSPLVWKQTTNEEPTNVFSTFYSKYARHQQMAVLSKNRPAVKARAKKRKNERQSQSCSKKAKLSYGPECQESQQDLSKDDLIVRCSAFYTNKVTVSNEKSQEIEVASRQQSIGVDSTTWHSERRLRLTSSNFGKVMSRKTTTDVAPLVKSLLYNKFRGNTHTRYGFAKERATRQEYELKMLDSNQHVTIQSCGLFINPCYPYLGASPDGIIINDRKRVGLFECKNLLQNKPITLRHAAKYVKGFCLELAGGQLKLKRNHSYYFQCQGQLNIVDLPWLDFVVRSQNPYQFFIERIHRDKKFWCTVMVPKLRAFYMNAILPELVVPRQGMVPGIREPGPRWVCEVYNIYHILYPYDSTYSIKRVPYQSDIFYVALYKK